MKFSFGKNWFSFATQALDAERVDEARRDFLTLFFGIPLRDVRFLDIGFGQGLVAFLAAEQGATVLGVDVDEKNLAAVQVSSHYFTVKDSPRFVVGSILEINAFRTSLGNEPFDVVHSWGVLHHSGRMWEAFHNAAALVSSNGYLVVSLYRRNWSSPYWWIVKWIYNHIPSPLQAGMVRLYLSALAVKQRVEGTSDLTPGRGMDSRHDAIDWLGGLPYEYASVDEVVCNAGTFGFSLQRPPKLNGRIGCVEYVFKKRL